MICIKSLHVSVLSFAAALAFAGCGNGSDSKPSASVTVNALQDTTVTAGSASLTIPAGALPTGTVVTLHEAEPNHAGGVVRFEVEPHGRAMDDAAKPARFSVRLDDASARVKLVDDHGVLQVEPEDRNHGAYKTVMSHLGEMEAELEHNSCSPACGAGFECEEEHGTFSCKAHEEHPEARTCATVCPSGSECDDGGCKLHSEVEPHDVGTTCVPSCAGGYHCDNGVCKT
jgi:hypothetical protein